MEPLYVLREHVMNKKPIHVEGDEIVFQNVRYPKSTPTSFQNRNNKEHYTLEVVYFAYQHQDSAHGAYVSACTKAKIKFLSLLDNKDLQAFLRGEIDASPSIDVAVIPQPSQQQEDERPPNKRQKTENLQDIEMDTEQSEEERQANAARLEALKAMTSGSTPAVATESSAIIEGISKETMESIKLKRLKMKNATITVEENLPKKPAQKTGTGKAEVVITKIIEREKLLSTRTSILNTNGKKNFTDIIQAVNKSAKKEELEAKAKLKDKNQKATAQTYDRYNVKEDQNWWKDKLKTNLEDFEIDTRGTFADGGSLALEKAPSDPSKSSQPGSRPSSSRPSSTAPSSSGKPSKHNQLALVKPVPGHPGTHGSSAIIIVPSALTSLLTLYNAQEFLQNGKYENSMAKRSTSAKATSATVTHSFKLKGLPETFTIVDNTTRMASKDWARVVAVFVLGQAWQFKDWQWSSPVELFSNVRGFYLRCDDTQAPPEVKSWNVKILTISKSKRHLDQTAALEFWNTLEEFLARKVKH